jgi:hypothetical protein
MNNENKLLITKINQLNLEKLDLEKKLKDYIIENKKLQEKICNLNNKNLLLNEKCNKLSRYVINYG